MFSALLASAISERDYLLKWSLSREAISLKCRMITYRKGVMTFYNYTSAGTML